MSQPHTYRCRHHLGRRRGEAERPLPGNNDAAFGTTDRRNGPKVTTVWVVTEVSTQHLTQVRANTVLYADQAKTQCSTQRFRANHHDKHSKKCVFGVFLKFTRIACIVPT